MRTSCCICVALVALVYAHVPLQRKRNEVWGIQNVQSESATTTEAPTSIPTDDVTKVGNCYSVAGVGTFAVVKTYDFTSGQLPSDLLVSDYSVPDQDSGDPWNHGFKPSNVFISDGFLNLRVPGGQNPAEDATSTIWGGEIYTIEANILHGSVRTEAMFDAMPGTCQSIFSYHTDKSEIDIEYMSNTSSLANPPSEPPVFWYTNQPGHDPDNQATGPASPDVDSEVHEYRIDWTAEQSTFYIDGVLQTTLKGSVPDIGSEWVWNNWSNGSPGWSCGPPEGDSNFKIRSITMYYNTVDGATC